MVLFVASSVPQLAMNILVVVLLLMVLVPGPNRRLRLMTAGALFLVGGVLLSHWRSTRRSATRPQPPAELPARQAPPSAENGVQDFEVAVPNAPRVQFKDGRLTVDDGETAEVVLDTTSLPAKDEIDRLVKASIPKVRHKTEGRGLGGALATIGVLIGASFVLKRLTGPRGIPHI
jgi:hypothetical protein